MSLNKKRINKVFFLIATLFFITGLTLIAFFNIPHFKAPLPDACAKAKYQTFQENLEQNPYQECKKGEIINVTSKTYQNVGTLPVMKSHWADGIYANEVSEYCSFEHPIVFLGSSKMNIKFADNVGIDSFTGPC